MADKTLFNSLKAHYGNRDITWLKMFVEGYLDAMLDDAMSLVRDSGEEGAIERALEYDWSWLSLAPETFAQIADDCAKFWDATLDWLMESEQTYDSAGAHFWYTRVGAGVGFWDARQWGEFNERLDAAAKPFGHLDPYVGDDGLIYFA